MSDMSASQPVLGVLRRQVSQTVRPTKDGRVPAAFHSANKPADKLRTVECQLHLIPQADTGQDTSTARK